MDDNLVKIVNKNMNLNHFLLIPLKDKLLNQYHHQQQMMMMMLIYLVMKMKKKVNKQNNV
jgi:hypothetical protein